MPSTPNRATHKDSVFIDRVKDIVPGNKIPLTHKQYAFVQAYCQYWIPKKAGLASGYPEKSAARIASNLLHDPNIQAAIAEEVKTLEVQADEAMLRLGRHSRFDMRDFLTVKPRVYPKFNPRKKYTVGFEVQNSGQVWRCVDDVEGIAPDMDRDGFYWATVPSENVVDLDLEKAIREGNTDVLSSAGYNKFGKLEVHGVDSQAATVQIARLRGMYPKTGADEAPQANAAVNLTVNVMDAATQKQNEWLQQQREVMQLAMPEDVNLLTPPR